MNNITCYLEKELDKLRRETDSKLQGFVVVTSKQVIEFLNNSSLNNNNFISLF